jgi:glutathionyl-hydroquinone reductase
MLPSINFLLLLVPIAIGNSEQEKWSWPEKHKDLKSKADNRRDIYFENFEQHSGRIRVPTSHDDNKRFVKARKSVDNVRKLSNPQMNIRDLLILILSNRSRFSLVNY